MTYLESESSELCATVTFKCPNCGEETQSLIENIPMYDYAAEVHSDGNEVETESVTCDNCHHEFEIELLATISGVSATMRNHNCYVNFHNPEEDYVARLESEYEEYIKFNPIEDPFQAYETAKAELNQIIEASIDQRGNRDAYFRMIFVHQIGILEAYLSD